MHKKNEFKIKGFPALVLLCVIYLIQLLVVCGLMKFNAMIAGVELDFSIVIATWITCKGLQILGYLLGVRCE